MSPIASMPVLPMVKRERANGMKGIPRKPTSFQDNIVEGKAFPEWEELEMIEQRRQTSQPKKRPTACWNVISVLAPFVGLPCGLLVYAIRGGHMNYDAGLFTLWAFLGAGFVSDCGSVRTGDLRQLQFQSGRNVRRQW